jgi:cholesterol transport system auxiliary component
MKNRVRCRIPRAVSWLLVPLLVALAGCASFTRPAPVRQTFLLEAPAPAPVAHPQPAALRVGRVSVAAPFRGKTFVYRTSDLRFENDYYVEFLVPPSAMLTEQTARGLQHAHAFSRVASPGTALDAGWILDGFASALYADMREAAKPAAELDVTYYLTAAGGIEQTPVWTHEYRRRVPMRDASAAAYAEALNKAFAEIVGALANDLAQVQLPKR